MANIDEIVEEPSRLRLRWIRDRDFGGLVAFLALGVLEQGLDFLAHGWVGSLQRPNPVCGKLSKSVGAGRVRSGLAAISRTFAFSRRQMLCGPHMVDDYRPDWGPSTHYRQLFARREAVRNALRLEGRQRRSLQPLRPLSLAL